MNFMAFLLAISQTPILLLQVSLPLGVASDLVAHRTVACHLLCFRLFQIQLTADDTV